eukprot:TRINITY_DN5382_c0_g1_i14.p1 TRINITY_DN5382_c0_g1~~TRINITY_DN5382_c0_g1_i14.p1  ORF type:complete len:356 (+),score=70.72 TRINITY_DN5382_c0_g1_i14:2306-3373(+)
MFCGDLEVDFFDAMGETIKDAENLATRGRKMEAKEMIFVVDELVQRANNVIRTGHGVSEDLLKKKTAEKSTKPTLLTPTSTIPSRASIVKNITERSPPQLSSTQPAQSTLSDINTLVTPKMKVTAPSSPLVSPRTVRTPIKSPRQPVKPATPVHVPVQSPRTPPLFSQLSRPRTTVNLAESPRTFQQDEEVSRTSSNLPTDNPVLPFEDVVEHVAGVIHTMANECSCEPAKDIGFHLTQIAKSARVGNKQGMLQEARAASTKINELCKLLRSRAASSPKNPQERVIQDRMIRAAQALQNFAMQLKILTSVKASSVDVDKDTDESLSSIVRGIGKAIQEGLISVEISDRTISKVRK